MNQKQIVKERLNYHFKKADGSWKIPDGMPFMNEFLNEVEKLASDGVLADVRDLSEESILMKELALVSSLVDQIGRDNCAATRGAVKIRIGTMIQRLIADNR